jgi:phage-related protein
MALGEASVRILPDLSDFEKKLKSSVTSGMQSVQRVTDQATEGISDSFREAARESERALDGISRDDAFPDIERRAEKTGESIEGSFREAARQSERALGGVSRGLGRLGAGLGAALAGIGLGNFLKDATLEAQAANSALANTAQLIESTGGAAGVTQQQISDLSDAMRFSIGIDDTAVIEASNVLLTFKEVSGPIFDETIMRAADLSAVFGSDLQGATMQLGKALNDPIKGLSALSRSGVSFSAEQKETIKTMVAVGDTAGAQRLILDELAVQFGGTAEASADSTARLAANFGELREAIGAGLIGALDEVTPGLLGLADSLMGPMEQIGEAVGQFAGPLLEAFGPAVQSLVTNFATVLVDIGAIFSALAPLIAPIVEIVGVLATAISGQLRSVFEALAPTIETIGKFLGQFAGLLGDTLMAAIDALAPALISIGEVLNGALVEILPVIMDLFRTIAPLIADVAGVIGTLWAGALKVVVPILAKLITALVSSLAPILPPLVEAFTQVADIVGGALLNVFAQILPPIAELITQLVAGLAPVMPDLIDAFVQMVIAMEPLIPALLEIVVALLPPLSELLLALVPIVAEVATFMGTFWANNIAFLAEKLEVVIGWVGQLARWLGRLISVIAENVQPTFAALVSFFNESVVPAFNRIVGFIRNQVIPMFVSIASTVASVATRIGERIAEIVGFVVGLPGRISDTISTLWDGLRTGITEAKNWVGEKIDDIVRFVTRLPGRVGKAITGMGTAGLDIGKAFIDGLKDGMTAAVGFAGDVASAVVDVVKSAWNTLAAEINNFLPNSVGVGPFALDLPDNPIPTFTAEGGVFSSAQTRTIAEAGREAVIPISRPQRAMEIMEISGLADMVRSSRGGPIMNIERATFQNATDADLVAQRLNTAFRARTFAA